jgi:hypothetical protein
MTSNKQRRFVPLWTMALVLLFGACSSGGTQQAGLSGGGTGHEPTGRGDVDPCATPQAGCSCEDDGTEVDCGRAKQTFDDYVTCSMGKRACLDGAWGECVGDRLVQVDMPSPQHGFMIQSLGSGSKCPAGFDVCDPYCYQTVDGPGGIGAGSNFVDTATGLKLAPSAGTGCNTLTLAAVPASVTITQISPLVATTVAITAAVNAGCTAALPFNVTWTVDRFDLAQVTGSNSTNGSLKALRPVTGKVRVTAYALGISNFVDVQVKLNVADSPTTDAAASPNKAATLTQRTALAGAGAGNSVTWLYPYTNTYFPLALPAPILQYSYSSGAGGAVKATLRYPANKTAATADFNYSLIVKEENTVSQTGGVVLNNTSPQITIPQTAWSAFEQSARGFDADLFVQRVNAAGTVETEKQQTIRLVDGQLKGTVYYNSYSSLLGPTKTGAVLKINPGATTPTLAIQPASGACTVCHTVAIDGSKIIAAGFRAGGPNNFNQSRRYDMTNAALLPSPTVLNNYNVASGDTENISGDKFNFGAVWTNGSLYMTHGGNGATSGSPAPYGDKNWRAPPDLSRLYDPNNPGTTIPVSGWSNISAVTPKFSQDGTKLAFGFWGANGSTLACTPASSTSCSAGSTLSAVTAGTRLAVADFKCSPGPCTPTSTFTVDNARDLTPAVTDKVAWPAISPDDSMVVYQRQKKSAKLLLGWSPSDVNTVAGALAELWISKVPTNSGTAAQPLQLKALNGLNGAGTSYLPTLSPYHVANGSFPINQADNCGVTVTPTAVNDYQLNYLPAFSPTSTTDHFWVVFTSRRMYGNIATDDPWDAEPGYVCNSGVPPAKKLWIAAIDKTWTSPTDPSHPAFYLPGQELKAGNSDGFWVNAACGAVGTACSTSDDCCGGTGATPTARCDALTSMCQTIVACKPVNQACVSNGDCCNGLVCGGASKCINPDYFVKQTYQREFVASCPTGTKVAWRLFEWQSTIPVGTSIDLAVQTRTTTTDPYQPAMAVALGSISTSVGGTSWGSPASTVDQVLSAATVPSLDRLLVSMTFNPTSDGATTPELDAWRMGYDCKPAE